MQAIFARKPYNLIEACFGGLRETIEIEGRREMTAAEYDAFTSNLLQRHDWLEGKGGHRGNSDTTLVVEVTAPGRKTLYINPEGSDYARYVGIEW